MGLGGGDYDFAILVTCLLILALQIHNPFLQTCTPCHCRDGAAENAPSRLQAHAASAKGSAAAPPTPSPVAYRPGATQRERPRAELPIQPTPSISTDELLRELDSIQKEAKVQEGKLAQAGMMPPKAGILPATQSDPGYGSSNIAGSSGMPTGATQGAGSTMPPPQMGMMGASSPPSVGASQNMQNARGGQPMPMGASPLSSGGMVQDMQGLLQRRDDFGRFLQSIQPRGIGVVLGVGRGEFALRLLQDWTSSSGIYLCDPFIHIWQGYDDPANLDDKEFQYLFENLRNQLAPFDGRYVLLRDFSFSFAETYGKDQSTPPPTFIYVDANHAEEAVARDLALWWPLLASGGVLGGSTYLDRPEAKIGVKTAVDKFVAQHRLQVYLTHWDSVPSWFVMKP